MVASVLKASAPLGILRLLVGGGAMPLYPEQRRYRALVSTQDYRAWIDAVVYGPSCPPPATPTTNRRPPSSHSS